MVTKGSHVRRQSFPCQIELLPLPLTYWPPKRQCGDDYWKESIGRLFSVSVTLLMMLKRLRLDKCTILYMTQIFFCPIWTIQKSKCPVNICFLTRWTPLEVCLFRVALEFVSLVYLTRRAHVTLLMGLICMHSRVSANEMKSKTLKPLFNVPKRLMIVSKWLLSIFNLCSLIAFKLF